MKIATRDRILEKEAAVSLDRTIARGDRARNAIDPKTETLTAAETRTAEEIQIAGTQIVGAQTVEGIRTLETPRNDASTQPERPTGGALPNRGVRRRRSAAPKIVAVDVVEREPTRSKAPSAERIQKNDAKVLEVNSGVVALVAMTIAPAGKIDVETDVILTTDAEIVATATVVIEIGKTAAETIGLSAEEGRLDVTIENRSTRPS